MVSSQIDQPTSHQPPIFPSISAMVFDGVWCTIPKAKPRIFSSPAKIGGISWVCLPWLSLSSFDLDHHESQQHYRRAKHKSRQSKTSPGIVRTYQVWEGHRVWFRQSEHSKKKNNYGKFTHGPPSARRLAVLTMPCQELFCSPRDLLRIHDGTTDHTADVPRRCQWNSCRAIVTNDVFTRSNFAIRSGMLHRGVGSQQ